MKLEVKNLSKSYGGKPVLQNLSFTAENGITGIMAPSGAGKTTLLRILMGIERSDSGTVTLPERCRISPVFQENRLLEGRSAMENLRFVAGPAMDEDRAAALLTALGLDAGNTQPVREYSGGMKRRLALARALLVPHDLLLLDEPFAGLDAENRSAAAGLVRDAARACPVLLVTHDETDAETLCDRVLRL